MKLIQEVNSLLATFSLFFISMVAKYDAMGAFFGQLYHNIFLFKNNSYYLLAKHANFFR